MTTQFIAESARHAAHAMLAFTTLGFIAVLYEGNGRDFGALPDSTILAILLCLVVIAYALGAQARLCVASLRTKTLNTDRDKDRLG